MRKNPKILFNPIDGSAPLSIYWFDGQKGDAVEANSGDGVGFFDRSENLLGIIFDDVEQKVDKQELLFSNGLEILIEVNNGNVKIVKLVIPEEKASA